MILRLVLHSQGYFYLSELCILCKDPSSCQVAQIMSARPDTGMQEIQGTLRQEMGTQSLCTSVQAECEPPRETGELTASQRTRQTWTRRLS